MESQPARVIAEATRDEIQFKPLPLVPPQVQPFLDALNSSFAPTLVVSYRDPSTPAPAIIAEATQGRDGVNGKAAAHLCRNFSCQPPITDGTALKAAVSGL